MSDRDGERLVRRFFDEVLTQGNLESLSELIAEEFVDYVTTDDARRISRADVVDSIRALHRVVSHIEFDVHDVVVPARDTVVVRWSAYALLGLWPLPPIEMRVHHQEHHLHIERGKISAIWMPPEDGQLAATVELEEDDGDFFHRPPGPPWVPPKPRRRS